MMCDECGKKPATVHITQVVNDAKTERHLCQECAQQHGQMTFMAEPTFTFHNLLAGLFDQGAVFTEAPPPYSASRCPNCGLTFADFRRLGHLGCSQCYETFAADLEPLLRRIHGSTKHTGKVPQGAQYGTVRKERELRRMQGELHEAVVNEEYEKAAKLRDIIRQLEQELARGGDA